MSKQNDGGPAFPRDHVNEGHNGMTLRDYFAAKAMQGIIAASGDGEGGVDYDEMILARSAYSMADAMLKAR